MLEIRQSCEHCDKHLANDSSEAMICTYECTFCADCVEDVLMNVCPNCGGGFEKRPTRPKDHLEKHPAQEGKIFKPVVENKFLPKYKNTDPRTR